MSTQHNDAKHKYGEGVFERTCHEFYCRGDPSMHSEEQFALKLQLQISNTKSGRIAPTFYIKAEAWLEKQAQIGAWKEPLPHRRCRYPPDPGKKLQIL